MCLSHVLTLSINLISFLFTFLKGHMLLYSCYIYLGVIFTYNYKILWHLIGGGIHTCVCTAMPDSLRPHKLYPTKLLCPWNFPDKKYWNGLPFPSPGGVADIWAVASPNVTEERTLEFTLSRWRYFLYMESGSKVNLSWRKGMRNK